MIRKTNNSVAQDFLTRHRYAPPEREGWYDMYDIQQGIRDDTAVRISSLHIARVLEGLRLAKPPLVEDTWMLSDDRGAPRLDTKYEHPDQPTEARRYYRLIDASVEYIAPQA